MKRAISALILSLFVATRRGAGRRCAGAGTIVNLVRDAIAGTTSESEQLARAA